MFFVNLVILITPCLVLHNLTHLLGECLRNEYGSPNLKTVDLFKLLRAVADLSTSNSE